MGERQSSPQVWSRYITVSQIIPTFTPGQFMDALKSHIVPGWYFEEDLVAMDNQSIPTLAEGVKIRQPVRGDAVLTAIGGEPNGKIPPVCIVEEEDILEGQKRLRRLGFEVEPTSAITWNALEQVARETPDPVVVILTGSAGNTLTDSQI